ncbi:tripartite motif-containing protein 35-like [Electrophorus electricus]|uniref:tripartite motif-containing protein 35-like n=1 Tax=Electrophorus electricus TaxID=8005 RepID=UPI0015CFE959|nr:tripartite motif-containing protein 35-like [Electrophorus electricus]
MAAKSTLSEEEFSCPVCCDIFRAPVILSCSHSVCKTCLQKFWELKGFRECPLCWRRSSKSDPPCNCVLKNLCKVFLESQRQRVSAGSEVLCSLHNEKLKVFCLEDKQPMYVVCQSSKKHKNHDCCPVDKAVCDFKNKLKTSLGPLQQNLKALEEVKQTCDETAAHIKVKHYSELLVHHTPNEPEKVSAALINVAKHFSNLKFRVWENIQKTLQYTPVTLDPNTAHPHLHLSDDLTTAERRPQTSLLPDNPERFEVYPCVLGSEGFNSGTHCWDVDVGGSEYWALGVIRESESRKGSSVWSSVWSLCYSKSSDEYWISCPGQADHVLTPTEKLQRVRVQLDCEWGKVAFTDLITSTHLHMITHTFTNRIFPLFFNYSSPLRILPAKISVTVENQSVVCRTCCHCPLPV